MPRLDFWFRLFHHAALGLASVCLLYAEAFFLPGPLLAGLYILAAVQVLAFGADGRRFILPAWAANLLAGAVSGGGAVWIAIQVNTPDSILADLPLPAGLLPYIGPILICLLVVKLFRPRTPRDFWLLQGVGALQVALACVLATNPESGLLFGALLAVYVAFALGCLALHYFVEQNARAAGREPSGGVLPARFSPPAADSAPFSGRMAPFCMRWTLAVAAAAAPFFLLTPRLDGPTWNSSALSAAGVRTEATPGGGFSHSIDLNRGGAVRLGGEEVFRVNVVPAPGEVQPTLPAEQRWRGGTLDTYVQGVWEYREAMSDLFLPDRGPPPVAPPLRSDQYRLDFTVGPRAGAFFLAEPVCTVSYPALVTRVDRLDAGGRLTPQLVNSTGPVLPMLYHGAKEYHYRQNISPAADPDRTPDRGSGIGINEDVRGLAEWTAAKLKQLAADPAYGLSGLEIASARRVSLAPRPMGLGMRLMPGMIPPPGASDAAPPAGSIPVPPAGSFPPPTAPVQPSTDPSPGLPLPAWEHVGRALEAYLARSGEYSYTLDLHRQDESLDPVMDFLVNVKAGHCERFASALALMLRSQGIPAQVVIGYRGAGEHTPDGAYVIRQNQAHAWVEMLAPHNSNYLPAGAGLGGLLLSAPCPAAVMTDVELATDPGLFPRRFPVDRVTLDPTPAADAPAPAPYTFWEWFQDEQRDTQEFWGGMIVNYDAQRQADLMAWLQSPRVLGALVGAGTGLPALAGLCAVTWVGLRGRRRAAGVRRAGKAASAYGRLLALLARHGGPRPGTGATPREFAAEARRFLMSRPTAAPFAGLPDELVDRLYRVLFGGHAPAAGETTAAQARLDQLAAALR